MPSRPPALRRPRRGHPWPAGRREATSPGAALSSFCLFLLMEGGYVLAGDHRTSVLGRPLQAAPWRQGCGGRRHAACVLRGFHLKKIRCFGFFCFFFFFKDSFKGVLKKYTFLSLSHESQWWTWETVRSFQKPVEAGQHRAPARWQECECSAGGSLCREGRQPDTRTQPWHPPWHLEPLQAPAPERRAPEARQPATPASCLTLVPVSTLSPAARGRGPGPGGRHGQAPSEPRAGPNPLRCSNALPRLRGRCRPHPQRTTAPGQGLRDPAMEPSDSGHFVFKLLCHQ